MPGKRRRALYFYEKGIARGWHTTVEVKAAIRRALAIDPASVWLTLDVPATELIARAS